MTSVTGALAVATDAAERAESDDGAATQPPTANASNTVMGKRMLLLRPPDRGANEM